MTMKELRLISALTTDRHFRDAALQLLLEQE